MTKKEITIREEGIELRGHISAVKDARSWIIFAHGSGSSRKSSRNNWVADELNGHGHSTFLFDLLTPEEDLTYENRFNIPLLATRLALATRWLERSPYYEGQSIGYFGASTGAGAALIAASELNTDSRLYTVISRGGRPDLAGQEALRGVAVPVLLIVGSLDEDVITLNEIALTHLQNGELHIIENATHLFEEAGKLKEVVEVSVDWLDEQLLSWGDHRQSGSLSEGGDHDVR